MQTTVDLSNLPDVAPDFDLQEMLEAGCHFGHQARRWHPKMQEWIYIEKEGVHIFDLGKTAQQLKLAHNYFHDLAKSGKTIVFVGTKRPARELVKAAAAEVGAFSITSRWLGGLLTNWEQVQKSLARMLEIEKGLQTDAYKGYTKYERVQLEKELNRLERFFGGLRDLKRKPDCLVVIDPVREKNAVKEANSVGVPVVGVVDTNGDPRPLDIAIPGNDDAETSIKYFLDAIVAAIKAGKQAK